jgi:hypothetical protein
VVQASKLVYLVQGKDMGFLRSIPGAIAFANILFFMADIKNTLPQSDKPCSVQPRTSSNFRQRLSE